MRGQEKASKEALSKKRDDNGGAYPASIRVWRDGQPSGQFMTFDGIEDVLEIAHRASYGMRPEMITIAHDSWVSPLSDNPMTEEPWGEGEISFMGENYPESLEKGWVHSAIVITSVDDEENWVFSVDGYTEIGDLEWLQEEPNQIQEDSEDRAPNLLVSGTITALKEILEWCKTDNAWIGVQQGENAEAAQALMESLGEEASLAHADVATLRRILEMDSCAGGTLYATPGTLRKEIVHERSEQLAQWMGYKMTTSEDILRKEHDENHPAEA